MRTHVLVAIAAMATVVLTVPRPSVAEVDTTAPAGSHVRGTPEPTPKVVIEAPRPPRATIETEGRAGDRDCRHAIAPGGRDHAKVTDPAQSCDPE